MSSYILRNSELVRAVVGDFLKADVFPKMRSGRYKRQQIAICVAVKQPEVAFEDAIIYEHEENLNGAEFEYPFDQIAYSKARLCYEFGMDTRELMTKPHLLRADDTMYAGGVFFRGFAIGVSGFEDFDDEAVGLQLGALLWGLGMYMMQAISKEDRNFLREETMHAADPHDIWECAACKATGIFRGMAEPEGMGVICLDCQGTGSFGIGYIPFTRRKRRDGVERVCRTTGKFYGSPVGISIPYEVFLAGEMPPEL